MARLFRPALFRPPLFCPPPIGSLTRHAVLPHLDDFLVNPDPPEFLVNPDPPDLHSPRTNPAAPTALGAPTLKEKP